MLHYSVSSCCTKAVRDYVELTNVFSSCKGQSAYGSNVVQHLLHILISFTYVVTSAVVPRLSGTRMHGHFRLCGILWAPYRLMVLRVS